MTGSSKFLFVSLIVVETTWWYTLAAVLGVLIGLGESPLNGIAVFLVLGVSAGLSLSLQSPRIDILVAQAVAVFGALITIYLAIAVSQGPQAGDWAQILWLKETLFQGVSYLQVGQQIIGGALGIVLWWRGMEIGSASNLDALLLRSFKMGLFIVTGGSIIDALVSVSFGMIWVAFGFFVAGLSALMLNQVHQEGIDGGIERRWIQIAGGTVGVVVLTGIVMSLLAGGAPAAAARWLTGSIGSIAGTIMYVIAIPIAYALEYLVMGLQWLIEGLITNNQGVAQPLGGVLRRLEELRHQTGERELPEIISIILTFIVWAVIIYLVLAVLLILYLSFVKRTPIDEDGVVRTSTWGDTPLLADMAMLLKKLLPQGNSQGQQVVLNIPEGDDPRSVLLRLYYNALVYAQDRGMGRKKFETPLEYHQSNLSKVFQEGTSRRLTEAFNFTRYGKDVPQQMVVRDLEGEVRGVVEAIHSESNDE